MLKSSSRYKTSFLCSVQNSSTVFILSAFNNTLNEYSNDGGIVKHSLPAGFTRNNLFLTEVKAFINACINEKSLDKNCSNGLDALKLAVKIKTNMEC